MSHRRKLYAGSDFLRALSIEELRGIARRRVPSFALEYVEGGAEDENALRWNREALSSIRLKPATLVDTRDRHQRTRILGVEAASPLVIAPTGLNGMLWHRGDVALARAAAAAGIPFSLSTFSNVRLEDVAGAAGGRLWMQLYVMNDRAIARDIVQRADRSGYEALVFTTDANEFGRREWDERSYRRPGTLRWSRLLDAAMHPRWALDVPIRHGIPRFENIVDFVPPEARSARGGVSYVPSLFAPDITWDDVAWMREAWPRKLVIKGVLTVDDARRAVEAGCDAVVLTNHGGRQLDACVSPLEVLPEIRQAVGDRLEIFIDSGFRRGADVVKALALGADAVLIGRPTLYGLAAGGEPGVRHAIDLLTTEIDRILGQMGCRSPAELGPHCVVRT